MLGARRRIANVRGTVRREAHLVRGILHDVKERFDLDQQVEPRVGRGVLGKRGSLIKAPIVLVTGTLDNAIEHVHGFAKINRMHRRKK